MTKKLALIGSALALAVGVAACGDDSDDDKASESTTAAEQTQTAAKPKPTPPAKKKEPERTGTEIQVADSQFGKVIWDGSKQAIYLFDKEKGKESECYDDCAVAWPPVLTDGEPKAIEGADQDLLSTTTRKDGKKQVTYNDHPLYYYDEPKGEIRCHNVNEFGGLWLVVKPDGDPVQ